MTGHVLVIDGHPDPAPGRLVHALAAAYAAGVRDSGREVRTITLAGLQIPLLRAVDDFATPPDHPAILNARDAISAADHIALIFPLWLGSAPALVRAFFEQIARAGFVAQTAAQGWKPGLKGKSARLIVTMGMPAFLYRTLFGGHGVQSWKKSILWFAGVGPIRTTLFGGIGAVGGGVIERRIAHVRALGRRD
jgi:putative NADPH-quinone reductase